MLDGVKELKPCPFCGGEARVQHQSRKLYGDVVDWYGVYCNKQFCGYVSGQSTEAEAIAAWNTRAERTCQRIDNGGYRYRFECSVCGCVVIVHDCAIRLDVLPNYCSNCGAKVVME